MIVQVPEVIFLGWIDVGRKRNTFKEKKTNGIMLRSSFIFSEIFISECIISLSLKFYEDRSRCCGDIFKKILSKKAKTYFSSVRSPCTSLKEGSLIFLTFFLQNWKIYKSGKKMQCRICDFLCTKNLYLRLHEIYRSKKIILLV